MDLASLQVSMMENLMASMEALHLLWLRLAHR